MTTYNKSLFTKLKPFCPGIKTICEDHDSEFYNTVLEGPGEPVVEFSQPHNVDLLPYENETSVPKLTRTVAAPPCESDVPYAKPMASYTMFKRNSRVDTCKDVDKAVQDCDRKRVIYDLDKAPCYFNSQFSCSTVEHECKSYEYLMENNYRNETLKNILENLVPFKDDDTESYCLNSCNK